MILPIGLAGLHQAVRPAYVGDMKNSSWIRQHNLVAGQAHDLENGMIIWMDLRNALIDAAPEKHAELVQDMVRGPVAGVSGIALPDAVDMRYFINLPWRSRFICDLSPTSDFLLGCGQAIPFIPWCFNLASPRHDQLIEDTLFHGKTTANGIDGTSKTPPLRHMISLF
ncbi:hypothetical protein CHU98_g7392 [Xylaria longipes]|nr:hypothetical protein CHU98_g7392 [Xylaria longipes]